MYIIIKYTEPQSNTSLKSEHVKKELLVNPDCPLKIISEYIKSELKIGEKEFDLYDGDGTLKKINDYLPSTRGTEIFSIKSTYFIVLVQRDERNQLSKPQLMYHCNSRTDTEMLSRIRQQLKVDNRKLIKKDTESITSMKPPNLTKVSDSNMITAIVSDVTKD